MSDDDLDTLDVAEAAMYLKMSKDAVMRRARSGEIPGAKLGKRWVFLKKDLATAIREAYSSRYTNRKAQKITMFDSRLAAKKLEERLEQLTGPKRSSTNKR